MPGNTMSIQIRSSRAITHTTSLKSPLKDSRLPNGVNPIKEPKTQRRPPKQPTKANFKLRAL